MVRPLVTLPPLFSEQKATGFKTEMRHLAPEEVNLFRNCDTDKKVLDLAGRYYPLFGEHRIHDEGKYSANDYRDFCNVLNDALTIRAVADGVLDAAMLDKMEGSYSFNDEQEVHSYIFSIMDSEDYWMMIQQGCERFAFFQLQPTAVTVADENIEPTNLFIAQGKTLDDLFSIIMAVHLVDVGKYMLNGSLMDMAISLASSIWLSIAESLQTGRVQVCQYRNCGKPFIVSDERGVKREYCCDSHKQMEWRKRKAESTNPAR